MLCSIEIYIVWVSVSCVTFGGMKAIASPQGLGLGSSYFVCRFLVVVRGSDQR
jgi:hypothetical protein